MHVDKADAVYMDNVSFVTALPGFLPPLRLPSGTARNIAIQDTFVGTNRRWELYKDVKRINATKQNKGRFCGKLGDSDLESNSQFIQCEDFSSTSIFNGLFHILIGGAVNN